MISTMITISESPWYLWCIASPGCLRGGLKSRLGPMDKAQEWYDAKLLWYSSFYERQPVVEHLEGRLTNFFKECKEAWPNLKVLEIKGTSTIAEARRSRPQERPTKAPAKPRFTPVDD